VNNSGTIKVLKRLWSLRLTVTGVCAGEADGPLLVTSKGFITVKNAMG